MENINLRTSYLTVLVGLPATGKSTFIQGLINNGSIKPESVLSTDANVMALGPNLLYDEAWERYIGEADKLFWKQLEEAIIAERSVVIDRTNMTIKSRRRIFEILKQHGKRETYSVQALVFGEDLTPIEWMKRLASRPGKTVPFNTLMTMAGSYDPPTIEEGFDAVAS